MNSAILHFTSEIGHLRFSKDSLAIEIIMEMYNNGYNRYTDLLHIILLGQLPLYFGQWSTWDFLHANDCGNKIIGGNYLVHWICLSVCRGQIETSLSSAIVQGENWFSALDNYFMSIMIKATLILQTYHKKVVYQAISF